MPPFLVEGDLCWSLGLEIGPMTSPEIHPLALRWSLDMQSGAWVLLSPPRGRGADRALKGVLALDGADMLVGVLRLQPPSAMLPSGPTRYL